MRAQLAPASVPVIRDGLTAALKFMTIGALSGCSGGSSPYASVRRFATHYPVAASLTFVAARMAMIVSIIRVNEAPRGI
jgi:hypothetical protein